MDPLLELKAVCKEKKIHHDDICKAFDVSPATCQRMLSGQSEKLRESIQLCNSIMELTGKLPFQLLGVDISNNPRLHLIDKLTRLTDREIVSLNNYVKLTDDERNRGKALFSEIYRAEAFAILSRLYHKIIKVNLTDDTVIPICLYNSEWETESKINKKLNLSEWIERIIDSDAIHPDHKKIVAEYANIPCLKNIMRLTEVDCSLEYLRLIGKEYRWVSMEVMRSAEYTPDNQIVLLCIKDIQNYHDFS